MFGKIISSFTGPKEGEWFYPDLPTPTNESQFIDVASQASLIREDWTFGVTEWNFHKELDDATIHTRKIEGSNINVVRANRMVRGVDFGEVVDFFYKPSYDSRKKLYEELTDYQVVREINEDTHVAHSKFKSRFPGIKDRDFLALRHVRDLDADAKLITIQSINDHSTPFDKNFVRGSSNCSTFLKPVDEDTVQIITTDHVEPRGLVPSWIVNHYVDKVGKRLWGVEELFGPKRLIEEVDLSD